MFIDMSTRRDAAYKNQRVVLLTEECSFVDHLEQFFLLSREMHQHITMFATIKISSVN